MGFPAFDRRSFRIFVTADARASTPTVIEPKNMRVRTTRVI